jgi:putative intracellular protease/amidase
MTKRDTLERYREMTADPAFREPQRYEDVDADAIQGLVIPGGHAKGVKSLYESAAAQDIARAVFTADKPVGAVCHGVLLLARTIDPATGRSVLHGRKTTALTVSLELSGWLITAPFLGSYYRTYKQTVQSEVTAALASKRDFIPGPPLPVRDSASNPQKGFAVRDGNYVSARWPGDCHRFASELVEVLQTAAPRVEASA